MRSNERWNCERMAIERTPGFAWTSSAQRPNAVVLERTTLRAVPAAAAAVVATVPRATEVQQGACTRGWCAAIVGTKVGYILQRVLIAAPAAAPQSARTWRSARRTHSRPRLFAYIADAAEWFPEEGRRSGFESRSGCWAPEPLPGSNPGRPFSHNPRCLRSASIAAAD